MTTFSEKCNHRVPYASWYELWEERRRQASPADPEDLCDRIAEYPSLLATGYKRDIDLRNGISLTLHRYELHRDLFITQVQPEQTGHLEFVALLNQGMIFPKSDRER